MNDGARKTILLVEDEVLIALDAANTIRGFGHDVVTANTGEEAVGIAASGGPIDLILMDIYLGRGMSGPRAAELILGKRMLPIVFLTSHAEREMVEMVHGLTRYGYVIKNSGDFVLKSSIEMAFELFQSHNALLKSEERYRGLFNHMVEGFAYCQMEYENGRAIDWIFIAVNAAFEKLTGLKDVAGRRVTEVIPGIREKDPELFDIYSRVSQTGKPEKFEMLVQTLNTWFSVSVYSPEKGIFVAVFDVITDRKRAENEKRLYQDELERFFDLVPDMICIATADGYFKKLNHAWEKILGYSMEEMLSRPFESFIHPDDIEPTRREVARQIGGQRTINFVNRYRNSTGDYRLLEWNAAPSIDGTILFASAKDITDRAKEEQRMADSLAFVQTVIESSPIAILTYKATGECVSANSASARLLGTSIDRLLAQNFRNIEPWKTLGLLRTAEKALQGGTATEIAAHGYSTFGKEIWFQAQFIPFNNQGEKYILVIENDILDRKLAEEKLAERSRFIETLVNLSPDILYIYDIIDKKNVYINDGIQRMLGYSVEEIGSFGDMLVPALMHPEDLAAYIETVLPRYADLKNGEHVTHEYRIRHKNGGWRWLESAEIIYRRLPEGAPRQIFGVVHDITEHRQAEEALRENEEKYRTMVECIPGMVYQCELKAPWRVSYISDAVQEVTGYPAPEFYGPGGMSWGGLVHEDDLAMVERAVDDGVREKRKYEIEYRIRRADGGIRWVYEQGESFYDDSGTPLWLEGVIIDITRRKEAEENLSRQQRLLQDVIDNTSSLVYVFDCRGNCLLANHQLARQLRTRLEDMIGKSREAWMEPAIAKIHYENDRKVMETMKATTIEEYADLSDGRHIYLTMKFPLVNESGDLYGIGGVSTDITETKRIETMIRESELKYRTVADFTYDWEHWLDPNGNYIYMSPSCERITGYKADEYTADPGLMLRIVHPADREAFVAHLNNLNAVPAIHAMDFRLLRRDGVEIWVSHTCQPVYGSDGSYRGQRGSNRDITARKLAEADLQKTLQEKEILLKELQHRVKNNLNVIYSLLGFELDRLSDPAAQEIFNNARSRILSMSGIYERLYQQPDIERLELGQYIREFSDSLFEMYAIDADKYRFSKKIADITLDLKRSVPLGLILNEMVSNALKYAYPGGAGGEIRIVLERRGDSARLSVSDDGRGLPGDIDPNKTASMGFMLVRMLAGQIGGSMTVSSRPGKGTTVAVEFKIEV